MNTDRILHVCADRLAIFARRGKSLLHDGEFTPHAEGLASFAAYVERHSDDVFHILADLAAEGFSSEDIPFLRGRDRDAVIARKRRQHCYDAAFCCAQSQGRSKVGRRDEQMLFAALTQPQSLEPWLTVLQQADAAVAGVFSMAQVVSILAAAAAPAHPQLLLSTLTRGGLRHTYFAAGRLRFSRLTITDVGSEQEALQACAAEAAKTYQYLVGQRLLSRGARLDVLVLLHPDAGKLLAHHCPNSDELQFERLDLTAVCRRHGLTTVVPDSHSDALFAHLLDHRAARAQFAPAPVLRSYRLRRLRQMLQGAGAVILAACVLVAGKLLLDAQAFADDTHALRLESEHDRQRLRSAQLAMPYSPLAAERLRLSVERYERLQALSPGPAPFYRHLSLALARYPQIQLDRLNWRLVEAGDETATPPSDSAEKVIGPGAAVVADIFASLPAELANDPHAQIDIVDAFTAQLKTTASAVQTLRPPVDPVSGSVLATADATATANAPKFSLRVVQEFRP